MKRSWNTLIVRLCVTVFLTSAVLPADAQNQGIDLSRVTVSGNVEFAPSGSGSYRLKAGSGSGGILITDPDVLGHLSQSKYLVIGVTHHNKYSGIMHIEFFAKDPVSQSHTAEPRIASKIGILPDLPTWLVFPIEYLDGQQVFLPRVPRQLKGVIFGKRIAPEDVAAIKLIPGPYRSPDFKPEFLIDTVYLTNTIPGYTSSASEPVVDEFGQWNGHDWPGRIKSQEDFNILKKNLTSFGDENNEFNQELSRYGGWKALRFDSTGFFHTHFDDHRWWFVDPEGYAFLSFGMDCVSASVSTTLQGNEDLYQWLPGNEAEFKGSRYDSNGKEMVDFFIANMARMFGKDWKAEWDKITKNKLVSTGFNTVGNWSDLRFARSSRLPYVLPMSGFPRTEVTLFRDFPDVYSPQYKVNAVKFAAQLEEYRDDPCLIGYFLENEPQWAFGDHDIAFEMYAVQNVSFSKLAFVKWLSDTYKTDINAFNNAWGLNLKEFSELNLITFKDYPSDRSREDFSSFTGELVDRYVGTVCSEVRKVDPNHLNLGMRYAYISSDLLYRAGEDFDVYSINGYNEPGPPPTAEIFEKTGKPVMIGEFHFGAIDRGLPSTGLKGMASTRDRAIAYRVYLEQGFSRPELIGIHYFQWMDQGIAGRFDGENYNIGFNDIVYQSYPELVEGARKSHERIYQVAAGKKKAYSHKAKSIPVIAF